MLIRTMLKRVSISVLKETRSTRCRTALMLAVWVCTIRQTTRCSHIPLLTCGRKAVNVNTTRIFLSRNDRGTVQAWFSTIPGLMSLQSTTSIMTDLTLTRVCASTFLFTERPRTAMERIRLRMVTRSTSSLGFGLRHLTTGSPLMTLS